MSDDIFTSEQVARMLELHPKTVRRYIREGRLNATRVGGQWRIKRKDLEVLMGERSQPATTEFQDTMGSIHDSKEGGKPDIQVSTVIDCYMCEEEATMLSNSIIAVMNCKDPDLGQAKYRFIYFRDEGKARFIIWGQPLFISKMLLTFSEISS